MLYKIKEILAANSTLLSILPWPPWQMRRKRWATNNFKTWKNQYNTIW